MIELDADCERRDGVTVVRARVTNGRGTAQQVTLRSTLDGPVWAPTAGPVEVPEWSEDAWCGVLQPGQTLGVGFATPAEPEEDPIEIADVERAPERRDEVDRQRTLSELESSAPPSEAIPRDP